MWVFSIPRRAVALILHKEWQVTLSIDVVAHALNIDHTFSLTHSASSFNVLTLFAKENLSASGRSVSQGKGSFNVYMKCTHDINVVQCYLSLPKGGLPILTQFWAFLKVFNQLDMLNNIQLPFNINHFIIFQTRFRSALFKCPCPLNSDEHHSTIPMWKISLCSLNKMWFDHVRKSRHWKSFKVILR